MKFSLIRMVFRRYRKIMISFIMIAALAIALLNGMFNAWMSLDQTLKAYLSEYGIADAVISTETTATDPAETLRQVKGIARVAARITGSSQLITASGNMLTAQIISMDNEDILRLHRWEEADTPDGDYVLADNWFAKQNGISAGDTLRIRTGEDEYRPFTVAAVVSAPETLERTKMSSGGNYYPDFGFLYAPISLLETETEKEKQRMTEEWQEKEGEYLQAKQEAEEAWDEGQAELTKAWEELEKQEKDFEDKREELKEQIRQLTEGRLQLMIGRKELDEAEETAEERKEQLEQALERMTRQTLETEDRIAELTEARNDLNSLAVQLEIAKGQLSVMRDEIIEKTDSLRNTVNYLNRAWDLWQRIQSGVAEDLPEEIAEQKEQVESMLAAYGITIDTLSGWIYKANNGVSQLESGSRRIQAGIAQINRDYLPEVEKYLEETEQGLEAVYGIHEALQNGISEIESGLKAIADFEQEAPDNQEEISQRLSDVEEALQQIYGGIEEAEQALSEGRETLEEKDSEAQEAHSKAEEELEEGARSLQEAWDKLQGWEGYTPMRNEFLIWFDEDVTDRRAALKAAEEALEVPVLNSELYDDSRVAAVIRDNLDPLWAMAVLVPLLFVAIMMVVLFLFLSIMIRQSRQTIGILRALGFSRGQVRRIFMLSCILLMLAASALGEAFSLGITALFNQYNQQFFSLPFFIFTKSVPVFALSAVGFVLLAAGAVALSTRQMSRIQPAEAFSRTVAAPPKIGRFLRLLLRRMNPLSKFSLLSLRRNPFRFVTSVICIAGAVSIIFAALSFIVSKNEVLSQVFGSQILYDGQIVFTEEPDEAACEIIDQMPEIAEAERYRMREENISRGEITVRGNLMFVEPGTTMISLKDKAGNLLSWPEEGIILSDSFAETLGVKAGDTVLVGDVEEKVAAVSHQMAMDVQYIPASEAGRFREAEQTGWLIRLREGADGREIANRLYREKGYVTILWKSLMHAGFQELFDEYDLYTWLLVALCGVIGGFIVVNTGRNNLQEQSLSLSVLRAIGFQQREISARWFLQTLLFFACSLLIGFAVGRVTAIKGLELLSNSIRHLEYIPSAFQYAWTAISTFVFVLAGHLITMRSMRKWDLVENTKGRE